MRDDGAGWLDRLAAPGPDPGGGAAAAVMLALGSALTQMVASYPPRPESAADLSPAVSACVELRRRALVLVDSDAAASVRLVSAWRAGGPDLHDAAVAAARSSADIIEVAAEAEPLLELLLSDGSRQPLADVAAAAVAYAAAVRTATVNLVGNLRIAASFGDTGAREADPVGGITVAEADALADRLDAVCARVRRELD